MAMQGPLAPWAPGMAETLTALGYRPGWSSGICS
jgi:hypothetical protein